MLVCNVSLRPPRSAIAAAITEAATAVDATATGNIVFATLVDDPASVGDLVDAYLGEIMLEAASAVDDVSAGAAFDAAVVEVGTANTAQDATVTGAPAFTTYNPADLSAVTLSGGNLIATGTGSTGGVRAIASQSSGKYYWENTYTTINSNGLDVGMAQTAYSLSSGSISGIAMVTRLGSIFINGSGTGMSIGTINASNVVGIAVDLTAKLMWWRIAPSGNWNGSGTANPATGTGGASISALGGALHPLFLTGATGDVTTANFGATPFTGSVPSGFTAGFT